MRCFLRTCARIPDPQCFRSKVDAHIAKALEKKPELVQISSASNSRDGAPLGRNRYVELELRKAKMQSQTAKANPAQKPCEKMTEPSSWMVASVDRS